jgi:hypothetical protein
MLAQQQRWLNRSFRRIFTAALATLMLATPLTLSAQEPHSSFVADVAKHVVLDPTTYVPAILAYDSTMRDWNSSQPFFRNGFVEHNPQFTASGLPNDTPLGYDAGRKLIVSDLFANLELSVANNVVDSVFERALIDKYPNHRKLVRAVGWIEKSAFASLVSYQLSASHYRQWQQNERMALQLGIR